MASTTRIYTQDDRSRRVLQLDDDSTVIGPLRCLIGTADRCPGIARHAAWRDRAAMGLPAVAYESGDPFKQPVWMCDHDQSRAQEAQLCGADWARSQSLQDTQA
jgi:hypothetical protein